MSGTEVATNRESVIEQHSVDYIPRSERHGKVWHQGPFWFTGNFVLPTLVTGFLGPSLGLSVWFSVLAIFLGACFGTFFMAFHANQGPRMGLPQMIQSRAQFGSRGAIVPFAATVFVYVGFLVFDTILATQGIALIALDSNLLWYPLLIALSIIVAVVGHDLLHFVQRWLTYILVVVFAIITIFATHHLRLRRCSRVRGLVDVARRPPSQLHPERRSDPCPPTSRRPPVPGFGTITVLVSVLALISIMGVNAYGAMLTGSSAIDGFKAVKPTYGLMFVPQVLAIGPSVDSFGDRAQLWSLLYELWSSSPQALWVRGYRAFEGLAQPPRTSVPFWQPTADVI